MFTKSKQKMFGKTKTLDDDFEISRERFKKLHKLMQSIEKDSNKYEGAIQNVNQSLQSLSRTFGKLFEEGGSDFGGTFNDVADSISRASDHFGERQQQVRLEMKAYLSRLDELKGKIKQRDDARLMFDAAQDAHAKLTEKNKEQFKIDKAAQDVEVTQAKYEKLNDELKEELVELFDTRCTDFEEQFKLLVANQVELFQEVTSGFEEVNFGESVEFGDSGVRSASGASAGGAAASGSSGMRKKKPAPAPPQESSADDDDDDDPFGAEPSSSASDAAAAPPSRPPKKNSNAAAGGPPARPPKRNSSAAAGAGAGVAAAGAGAAAAVSGAAANAKTSASAFGASASAKAAAAKENAEKRAAGMAVDRVAADEVLQEKAGQKASGLAKDKRVQQKVGANIAKNSSNPVVKAAAGSGAVQGVAGKAVGAAATNKAAQKKALNYAKQNPDKAMKIGKSLI